MGNVRAPLTYWWDRHQRTLRNRANQIATELIVIAVGAAAFIAVPPSAGARHELVPIVAVERSLPHSNRAYSALLWR